MNDQMRHQLKTLIIKNRMNKIRTTPQPLHSKEDSSQLMDNDDQFLDDILNDTDFTEEELQNELMKLETCLLGESEKFSNNSIVPVVRPVSDYTNTLNEMEGKRLEEVLTVFKQMEFTFGSYEYKPSDVIESTYFIGVDMDRQIETLVEASKQLSWDRQKLITMINYPPAN